MYRSTFKPLCAALLAAGLSSGANAVQLSSTGTGQVLLFPYYTVRNGFVTQLTVVNTQANTKLVKVRFREAINGRNVMDFAVFLPPNDTWTAAVVPTTQGTRIVSNDNSCATPSDLFTETRTDGLGAALNAFKNYLYSGAYPDDPNLSSMDRTREGYFEVFEMGVIDPTLSTTATQIAGYAAIGASTSNCAALDNFDPGALRPPPTLPDIGALMMAPPRGGLAGRASLINAATGANYSFTPTALEAFTTSVVYGAAGVGNVERPSLTDASPAISTVMTPAGVVTATWATGRDAVSAVLMRETIVNEFMIDEGTVSQTDWIVNMPTKPFYSDRRFTGGSSPLPPFSSDSSTQPATACELYSFNLFNREGASMKPAEICPLPPPAPVGTRSLCLATSIVPLASRTSINSGANSISGLLGAAIPSRTAGGSCPFAGLDIASDATTVPGGLTTPSLRSANQGANGVIKLQVGNSLRPLTPVSAALTTPAGVRTVIPGIHYGLPMIGLMLHNYKNANVASRYGGVLEHRYTLRIE